MTNHALCVRTLAGRLPTKLIAGRRTLSDAATDTRVRAALYRLAALGEAPAERGPDGWQLTPTGSREGEAVYLWWRPQNNRRPSIEVRGVGGRRKSGPPDTGRTRKIGQSSGLLKAAGEYPWSDEQREVIESPDPIRTVASWPGTGLSTMLAGVPRGCAAARILMVVRSTSAALGALRWLKVLAPPGAEITVGQMPEVVAEIRGEPIPEEPTKEQRRAFAEVLEGLDYRTAGTWMTDLAALEDELRGTLIGRAPAHGPGQRRAGSLRVLDEAAYSTGGGGREDLKAGTRALTGKLPQLLGGKTLATRFPDLAAASKAADAIDADKTPPMLQGFDCILVDGAEQHTLLELGLLTALARVAEETTGTMPTIVVGGDESQASEPTSFSWFETRVRLLSECPISSAPRLAKLHKQQRVPRQADSALAQAYRRWLLETKRGKDEEGPEEQAGTAHVKGQTFYVRLESVDELEQLANATAAAKHAVAIYTTGAGAWDGRAGLHGEVPWNCQDQEWQIVCVMAAGRTVIEADEAILANGTENACSEYVTRRLRQLIVATSRTSEAVIFAELEPDEETESAARDLSGTGPQLTTDEATRYIASFDADREQFIGELADESRKASTGYDAFRLAQAADTLAGEGKLAHGATDPGVREAAGATTVTGTVRLLIQERERRGGRKRPKLSTRGAHAARTLMNSEFASDPDPTSESSSDARLTTALFIWLRADGTQQMALDVAELLRIRSSEPEALPSWLEETRQVIGGALSADLTQQASNPSSAAFYAAEDVAAWLEAGGLDGGKARAHELAATAAASLIRAAADGQNRGDGASRLQDAASIAATLPGTLAEAATAEALGRRETALAIHRRRGDAAGARRMLRELGRWHEAADGAKGRERERLEWLARLAALVESRPAGHDERLRPAEKSRLSDALATIRRAVGVDNHRPS